MEPHSQKNSLSLRYSAVKHSAKKNGNHHNKNSKINHHISPARTALKQGFWQKISEVFAIIFKKNDKTFLLKSINKLVDNCEAQNLIAMEEKKMIKNIINIGDVKVNDVMITRTDIVAVKHDADLDEIKEIIIAQEHTRVPVYRKNLDEIIGFIHSKDLVKFLGGKASHFKINDIIRKVLYVPESMRIVDLLLKMRSSRVHIAIVLDEYGGTDGLVTIEDVMEEIVGEIEDEHDLPDNNVYMRVNKISEDVVQVGGRVEIEKVEELLERKIIDDKEEVDFDTVGGLVLAFLKKVPEVGEVFKHQSGLTFKVLEADMRSVKLIEINKDKRLKDADLDVEAN